MLDDFSSDGSKERFFKRFMDYMFAAVDGTQDQSKKFVDWMNTLWPGLSLTFDWSNKEITFLDVRILIENEKLEIDWLVKPTNP